MFHVALSRLSSQLCAVYGMLRTYLNTVHLSPASTDSECLHDSRFCTMAHRCWRILTGMALHLQLVPVLPVALPPLATWCKSFSEAASSSNALKFFTNNAVKYSSPCCCLCPHVHTAFIQNVVPAVDPMGFTRTSCF